MPRLPLKTGAEAVIPCGLVPKSRGMESLLTNKESFMNSNRLWEDHQFLCNCPAKHAEVDHQLSWKIIPHLIILTFQDLKTPQKNIIIWYSLLSNLGEIMVNWSLYFGHPVQPSSSAYILGAAFLGCLRLDFTFGCLGTKMVTGSKPQIRWQGCYMEKTYLYQHISFIWSYLKFLDFLHLLYTHFWTYVIQMVGNTRSTGAEVFIEWEFRAETPEGFSRLHKLPTGTQIIFSM